MCMKIYETLLIYLGFNTVLKKIRCVHKIKMSRRDFEQSKDIKSAS